MAMRIEIIDVTPEMASAWMDKNASFQRKQRSLLIDRYARDMANGKWTLTHQGVAFDSKGRLIDGQHRLLAIIKSGVTVKMLVMRDVPATAFDHVDLGFGRTASDVLKARGEGWITNDHLATVRYIECGDDYMALTAQRSPFELRDMVDAHKNAIEFVFQNIGRKVRRITIAPVLGAIALAHYYEMDRVKLSEFIRLIVDGVAQNPSRDETAIRFREWLRDFTNSSIVARIEIFYKTQRVVKAFMRDERITKFYTPSSLVYPVKRLVLKQK